MIQFVHAFYIFPTLRASLIEATMIEARNLSIPSPVFWKISTEKKMMTKGPEKIMKRKLTVTRMKGVLTSGLARFLTASVMVSP